MATQFWKTMWGKSVNLCAILSVQRTIAIPSFLEIVRSRVFSHELRANVGLAGFQRSQDAEIE